MKVGSSVEVGLPLEQLVGAATLARVLHTESSIAV